jgi:predicted nucleotidyltransferase
MLDLIEQNRTRLIELCRKYRVRRLDLFGSAAQGKFDQGSSDLDFFVEFEDFSFENAVDRYFGLLNDLEDLFQRKIDLVTAGSVRNPYFKQALEQTRVLLYAA